MTESPALYWCKQCSLYTTAPIRQAAGAAVPFLCHQCDGPVELVDPAAAQHNYWCRACDLTLTGDQVIPAGTLREPHCPHCGNLVEPGPAPLANPMPTALTLTLIGVVARLLHRAGALDALDSYTKGTKTKIDDLAARIVRGILLECANL